MVLGSQPLLQKSCHHRHQHVGFAGLETRGSRSGTIFLTLSYPV